MAHELTQEQKDALKQYPKLETAINEYIELNGRSRTPGHLSDFVYWLRCKIEKYFDGDPGHITCWPNAEYIKDECLEDDEDIMDWDEDFWSWGHNSRWANTFALWVDENFSDMVDSAIELAEEYGDEYETDEE